MLPPGGQPYFTNNVNNLPGLSASVDTTSLVNHNYPPSISQGELVVGQGKQCGEQFNTLPSTSWHNSGSGSGGGARNSPVSDSLLLALHRSQPNTRYIPLRDSPNDNPHLELSLQAGDYILVHGQMDEDQFYLGETLNGRTGLVPSNYGIMLSNKVNSTQLPQTLLVERVTDHALLQNAARAPSPSSANPMSTSFSTSLPHNDSYAQPQQPIPTSSASTSRSTHPSIVCANKVSVATQSPPISTRSLPNTLEPATPFFNASTSTALPQLSNPPPLPHRPITSSGVNESSGGGSDSPSFALNVPPHFAQITHDFTDFSTTDPIQSHQIGTGINRTRSLRNQTPLPDSVCPYPAVDVSKVIVQEVKSDQPKVPLPRELNVEKRLSRSAVFCWLPPDDQLASVSQYHVCVDGAVKAVVPGSYKCKALIEELELGRAVNVSVRAITENGHSPDAACTIAVGAEAPVAPQHVRVTNITPISAHVYWYPSNSNAEHVLLLNALKVGVCPPTVFQVQLQGLSPSTIYRVSVRTKHPKAVLEKRPVERCVDFKTLPKIGLPDPPENVQVEVGPQPNTLLISWKPVTSQPRPPSRAAIQSYLVFADGKNIAQVPSATDHVLLRLADLSDDPPIFITVRTRTREGTISADSNVLRVPRTNTAGVLSTAVGGVESSSNPTNYSVAQGKQSQLTNQIGSIQPAMPSIPLALLQQQQQQQHPSGLLTTVEGETMMASGTSHMLNTAYALGQPQTAILSAQPGGHHQPSPLLTQPLNVYTANSQQVLPQHYTVLNQYSKGHRGSAPGLHNGGSPRLYERKQSGQTYYTFHPKSLYKEVSGGEEKPSVLELENNYLLKHHQQYRERDRQQQWISPLADPRVDYYVQSNGGSHPPPRNAQLPNKPWAAATVMAGGRRPPPSSGSAAIPPRLARVRSDEFLLGTRSEPDLRPMATIPADEENSRWFVALYDYSHHMSPNPNAQQEELSFRKHQLIKVYGEADQDGFYYAEIGRRFGLIPSNMVIEIAKDEVVPDRRRSEAYPADPVIRRMRWGSLKSRSYDHPASERRARHPSASSSSSRHPLPRFGPVEQSPHEGPYSSLERRERSMPPTARYGYDMGYEEGGGGKTSGYGSGGGQLPLSARSAGSSNPPRHYGYASTSYDNRRFSSTERPREAVAYEQGGRIDHQQYSAPHRDSYPSIKRADLPARAQPSANEREYYGSGSGGPPPQRRPLAGGGDWREYGGEKADARGPNPPHQRPPPDQYDYSSDHRDARDVRTVEAQHQQHYPPERAEAQQQDYASARYDSYNDTNNAQQPPGAPYGGVPSAPRMRQQDSVSGRYDRLAEEQGGGGVGWSGQSSTEQYGQQAQQYQQQAEQQRYNNADPIAASGATRRMVAMYDYDSTKLSPNVDAEQVELSFRQGDVIIVFGIMDEDGFYIGELNGVRGLVPSNFLQPSSAAAPNTLMAKAPAQLIPGAGPLAQPYDPPRPKGVVFSSEMTCNRKPMPSAPMAQRQTSQGSTGKPAIPATVQMPTGFGVGTGGTGMTSKANKIIGGAPISSTKQLTKKTSDLTSKSLAANNVGKKAPAKKSDGSKKK